MATYVLLTRVTPAGIKTLQSNPRRIKEVNKEIEAQGARVVAQYATLGRYDFVNIVEAKDSETIAKVSVGLGARGTLSIETLTAIPIETFIRGVAGRKGTK
ncbi:MAG TPA: GYD domain-containing protein [Candidatus Limnocylindria bacterium]